MDSLLLNHTCRLNEAISELVRTRHNDSALILIYSFIDRMAWLNVDDVSNGNDFKNWVNQYLLPQANFLCTADDLWGARCALLHTGTVVSKDSKNGKARKVQYHGNAVTVNPNSVPPDEVFVNFVMLQVSLTNAVICFNEALKLDSGKLETAKRKLNMLLQRNEVHQNQPDINSIS